MGLGILKDKAHTAVTKALREGTIQRPNNCIDCGVVCKPYAHHEDYDKWLEVDWLCSKCHPKRHKRSKEYNEVPCFSGVITDIEQRSVLAAKRMIFAENTTSPLPYRLPPPLLHIETPPIGEGRGL